MGLDKDAIANIQTYQRQAASLLLYQSVLDGDIGQAFLHLLDALIAGDDLTARLAYGEWFSELATHQQSWHRYLISQILLADNAFSQAAQNHTRQQARANGTRHSSRCLSRFRHSRKPLQHSRRNFSQWTAEITGSSAPPVMQIGLEPKLPINFPYSPDWRNSTSELADYYRTHGVGIFGQFKAFRWQAPNMSIPTGQLAGIETTDPISIKQLVGYDHPKQQIIQNTEFLIDGYTAQNVLLYGSRGAGKSSLVKALLNEYCDRGLRLIEVPQKQPAKPRSNRLTPAPTPSKIHHLRRRSVLRGRRRSL